MDLLQDRCAAPMKPFNKGLTRMSGSYLVAFGTSMITAALSQESAAVKRSMQVC